MKRIIKVTASFSGVLPTGSYENMRPGFSAEEEFEFDGETQTADQIIKARQQDLQSICYQNYEAEAENITSTTVVQKIFDHVEVP